MAPSTLVLFTDSFPYGRGEQFLEAEIPYLQTAFERVVVIPLKRSVACRTLPEGVRVDPALASVMAGGKWRALVVLASGGSLRTLLGELRERPRILVQPRALLRALALVANGERVRHWLQSSLRHRLFAPGDTIFYSYWLNAAVLGSVLLGAKIPLHIVSRAHGSDLYAYRQVPPYLPFQGMMIAGADRIFPVSLDGRGYLAQQFPVFREKVEVARLGAPPAAALNQGSSDGVFRVVSCSNLLPIKRLELLVGGLSSLSQMVPEQFVEWFHLGDGPERESLVALAQRMLPTTVRWEFLGQLSHSEVLDFFSGQPVDVLVNVSTAEGVPVSIMEAMSHGIPVLATAVGGTPEIVNAGNGVLLGGGATPEQVGTALTRFFPGSPEVKAWRRGALATWEEHYDARVNYLAFAQGLRNFFRPTSGEG